MRRSGDATKYPGVKRVGERVFRVRGKVIDPRTGRRKEIDRVVEAASVHEAARARAELLRLEERRVEPARRLRVGEYAQSWMRSKALKLDGATARTYADALERHILPALGELFYDQVTARDVQAWVDEAILNGWKTKRGRRKKYSPKSVHAWFRVFRTMTRDAMHELGLERDSTLRVDFPEAEEKLDGNCLEPEELAAFLAAMKAEAPQHWGLSVLLAYTGLRFCHASALRWEDWDRARSLIRVVRKQVRGKTAAVTRKKQAPREIPVEPELAAALDEHRAMLLSEQAPGLAEGWMFPSSAGTLRSPSSLYKAWRRCIEVAEIGHRFTVHGMRYTFTDLVRRANVDAVVRRALTGHVTEQMQRHYSHVSLDEKRAAVAGVLRLVPPSGGDRGGDQRKGRLAQSRRRPEGFERDKGFEPSTFSLGS